MGRKVSDRFTVPICRLHHRELHRRGNERAGGRTKGSIPFPSRQPFGPRRMRSQPTAANIAGDRDQLAGINGKLNGRHFGNGPASQSASK